MPDLRVIENEHTPTNEQRILRVCNDARILARTVTGGEVASVWLILEAARDDLSRILERGDAWRR